MNGGIFTLSVLALLSLAVSSGSGNINFQPYRCYLSLPIKTFFLHGNCLYRSVYVYGLGYDIVRT
jgi:hypothetical protein